MSNIPNISNISNNRDISNNIQDFLHSINRISSRPSSELPTYSQIFSSFFTNIVTRALTNYVESYDQDNVQNVQNILENTGNVHNINNIQDNIQDNAWNVNNPIQEKNILYVKDIFTYKEMTSEQIQRYKDCAICYIEYKDSQKDNILLTPCNHSYHENCLVEWAIRNKSCPECRAEL